MSHTISNPKHFNLNSLGKTEWLTSSAIQTLFNLLNEADYEQISGHKTRIVGGAIRNTLLGEKITDIDFATTHRPEMVIALADRAGLKSIPTGVQHGTVTLVVDGATFEVTTLRRDVETFGRQAKVAFTDSWEQDAHRRDFTMNAIYVDQTGELYDPCNGYQDIQNRCVRFIGNPEARICEDYLRILRYFRFQAQYGLAELDLTSLHACVKHRFGLRQLSSERITAEVLKLLGAPYASTVIQLMYRYGLLVDLLKGVPYLHPLNRLLSIYKHIKQKPNSTLCLAILAIAVTEDAARLEREFSLSKQQKHVLRTIAALNPHTYSACSLEEAQKKLYDLRVDDYVNVMLASWARSTDEIESDVWQQLIELPEHWQLPVFPIKGADLTNLGFAPGPQLGRILHQLEKKWVNSQFRLTRSDLVDQAQALLEH